MSISTSDTGLIFVNDIMNEHNVSILKQILEA